MIHILYILRIYSKKLVIHDSSVFCNESQIITKKASFYKMILKRSCLLIKFLTYSKALSPRG